MKIQEILSEGISDVLYHFTTLQNANKILSSDQFNLTSTFNNSGDSETGNKKLFYLSTTRSVSGGYTKTGSGSTVLVLDGKKLSHNYTGEPVDYWGRTYRKMDNKYNEMEDRIYHKEPQIPNASKYIKTAHIYFEDISAVDRSSLLGMKKAGIPVYLYNDTNAFLHQNTKQAKNLKDFEIEKNQKSKNYRSIDKHAVKKQQIRVGKRKSGGMQLWITLLNTPVSQYQSLSKDVKYEIEAIVNEWNSDDLFSLEGDLQNTRNDNGMLNRLSTVMNKYKLKSASDILNFIINKWKDTANNAEN